jgi:uncharacterized membrane protein
MHYFPLPWPFVLALFVLLVALAILQLWVIQDAYRKMGISRGIVFGLLVLSLLGSYINLPVAELPTEKVVSGQVVQFRGMLYIVPEVTQWPGTVIAVNLGGAIIPTVLSLYLTLKNQLFLPALVGVAIVSLIVHLLAQPVEGVGITVPVFVPPLAAAVTALLLSWSHAPALAYIAGSLGTLIGADLLNLPSIQSFHAPVASIGGAGTFDSIFVTGILAVLLVSIGRPAPAPQVPA